MEKEISKDFKGKYSYDRPRKDITGQKFNNLTVIEWLGFVNVTQRKRRSLWKCLCDCGNYTNVQQSSLVTNNTKSCGCRAIHPEYSYKGSFYSSISAVLNNYKQSAKKRGYSFELTREYFTSLLSKECFYCGALPSNEMASQNTIDSTFFYNGVDRLYNTIGYTENNTVACCKQCNFLKKDVDYPDFIELITKIYKQKRNEY